MWTPKEVIERISSRTLLPDSMFKSIDPDEVLDARDDSFEDDWLRAAEALQAAWERSPDAESEAATIDAVREVAFRHTFDASGGHHDLAATVSDDLEVICKRAFLGAESPFITSLEEAYDAHQIPQ